MRLTFLSVVRPLCHAALATVAVFAAGCASAPNRAPVEERSASPRAAPATTSPAGVASTNEPARPAVVEPGPRLGYYVVKPGDTLIRISLDSGQNWKDLVRWNSLDNPNVIEVGQSLRVVSPGVDPTSAMTRPVASNRVETRPLEARAPSAAAPPPPGTSTVSTPSAAPLPRRRLRLRAREMTTSPGAGRRVRRYRRHSTKREARAWCFAARPATRCLLQPMAAWSTPARAFVATATS